MTKTMKMIMWVAVAAAVIYGFAGLNKKVSTTPTGRGPIKIGALLTLTGVGQAWGENAKKGIELALEEFEVKHNVSVEVIYEDTHSEPKTAITAYRKLVDLDKVSAIIGPLMQAEASALSPIIAAEKIPVVSPAYAPIANRPDVRNPLFVWMDPQTEAAQMAVYVYENGPRRVAIIGTRDNWENEVSEAFAEKFRELGGEIVATEIVQPNITDNRLSVTKVLAQKPDAIFLGTYYQFVNSLKALSDFGFQGKIYSIEVDQYLANEAKSLSDGLRFIAPDFYTSDFVDRFTAKYNTEPGIPTGQSYDAANLVLDLVSSGTDTATILSRMRDLSSYDGVSGKIVFTPDHKTILPTAIYEVRGGAITKVP